MSSEEKDSTRVSLFEARWTMKRGYQQAADALKVNADKSKMIILMQKNMLKIFSQYSNVINKI